MQTTKVTFHVFTPFNRRFNQTLNELFLKRDSFLDHLISAELFHLEKALKGKKNSEKAKRYINDGMDKKRTSTALTVVVKKHTAERLRKIVTEHNINRDAFINRLFLFMILKDGGLKKLGIPTVVHFSMIDDMVIESVSTSPFQCISQVIADPFFYIRTVLENDKEDLYLTDLSEFSAIKRPEIEINKKNEITYFYEKTIIYISDDDLPSNQEMSQEEFEELLMHL